MKKIALSLFFLYIINPSWSQKSHTGDDDWAKQFIVLKNTPEADVLIRVGDIDNLSFGWEENFNPFSGRSTPTHGYPWKLDPADAKGTDRIMVPTSYRYGGGKGSEGYTNNTQRPGNKPVTISIPLQGIKGMTVDSAVLQLFIDDFQSPSYGSKYQFKVNGTRFTEAEKMISRISQDGPIGKLVTIWLTPELLQQLNRDSLVIYIDDPTTGIGDGYAIDFVRLLINPKVIFKGNIKGRVIYADTREPVANATVEVEYYGMIKTDAEGNYNIENIPAGLNIVKGSYPGYLSDVEQADVIAGETTEVGELELKPSVKLVYDNITLQEGDKLVMNNIQFNVSSAALLPAGKTELGRLAAFMKQNPSVEILLSGHTSAEGAAAVNRELSLKRVRSCKDYLASKGIDEGRITIKGLGPDQPMVSNDTESNRALNRRVEMMITKL